MSITSSSSFNSLIYSTSMLLLDVSDHGIEEPSGTIYRQF